MNTLGIDYWEETDAAGRFLASVPALNVAAREAVMRVEDKLRALPQVECPVEHYFVDGLYVREIFIKKGVALVGYIHMMPCITTVLRGEIVIFDGEKEITLRAGQTFEVQAGTKKSGLALEDTLWSDSYANPDNERNIEVLEARLTADTHEQFIERTRARLAAS